MSKHLFWILFIVVLAGCSGHETKKTYPESVLPSLYITIQPEQLDSILHDREHKASAEALLLSDERDTIYSGELTQIKTRGNYTFRLYKKAFSIKFPYKIRMLGLDKDRSFVLLSNACDESHIRNAIGLDLARAIGIPASRYAYVRLFVNNRYFGLYQITNKVEVGRKTLNITDLGKLNELINPRPLNEYTWFAHGRKNHVLQRKGVLLERNPEDISGGYLLDNCGINSTYYKCVSGFVSQAGDPIRIRSPKYASPEEVEYIADVYDQMEKAVLASDSYNSQTGRHYSEYIDTESFARYYLLNELLMNLDGGMSSFMMYKDKDSLDSKIYAGPAWDYDIILNNPLFTKSELILPNEVYVGSEQATPENPHSGGLLYHLMKHEDFREIVKSCYYQEISLICHEYLEHSYWDSLADGLYSEAERDNQIYGYRVSKDYATAVSRTMDFFKERVEFFDWYYSAEESEMIRVAITKANNKKAYAYYPLGTAIHTPQLEWQFVRTPVCLLCYEGTDNVVKEGAVFQTPQHLEFRDRDPKWREIQWRRIRKMLNKWWNKVF